MTLDPSRISPEAPVGVFDSGVGGLTVLTAIREACPAESVLYLGDTARVPYGPKSPDTVRRYTDEAARFLMDRGVKILVLACNTASARALPDLASRLPVPVVGVIEPGARDAVSRSASGRVGVIGTRGTIESGAYERAIDGLREGVEVHVAACPLFVSLVEEGWTAGQVARLTAERYLAPLLERSIDTLLLACTHYPLLKPLLSEVVGDGVVLVDSARATAAAVERRIGELGIGAPDGNRPEARFYVTDDAERFRELARRFTGAAVEHLEQVSLEATGRSRPPPG